MKRQVVAVLAGLLAASLAFAVHAAWPERPITIVNSYPAGGQTDNEARLMAQWLTKALKQSVIVENRTGANGAIAADFVARARPDGYTLWMTAAPTMVMVPHMQKVNYDSFKSFAPISIMDGGYVVFAVNPSIPARTLPELIAYAKAQPNPLTYAAGGAGSTGHLSMALLLKRVGMAMTLVPYKGSSDAAVAVIGGHVPLYVGTLTDAIEHHKAGKLRIIGVSSGNRLSEHPDIATIAEQGFPGYRIVTWSGLLAPAGTPKEVITTMADSLRAACRDAAFNAAYQALGVEAVCSTPEQFAERLRTDWVMWGEAIKASGAALQ